MSVHYPPEWLRSQDISARVPEHLQPKAGPLARLAHAVAVSRKRARERRELQGMSDRELRDIGITRADIDRVLGPAFAREYATPDRLWEMAPATNTTKQEITMKTIFAALFVALIALTGVTATAHAYDAAPDRTTVSGNAAG
jgi:uncharacterized protein YjiS (DUF1127 family)